MIPHTPHTIHALAAPLRVTSMILHPRSPSYTPMDDFPMAIWCHSHPPLGYTPTRDFPVTTLSYPHPPLATHPWVTSLRLCNAPGVMPSPPILCHTTTSDIHMATRSRIRTPLATRPWVTSLWLCYLIPTQPKLHAHGLFPCGYVMPSHPPLATPRTTSDFHVTTRSRIHTLLAPPILGSFLWLRDFTPTHP